MVATSSLVRDQEVESSNLSVPTISFPNVFPDLLNQVGRTVPSWLEIVTILRSEKKINKNTNKLQAEAKVKMLAKVVLDF